MRTFRLYSSHLSPLLALVLSLSPWPGLLAPVRADCPASWSVVSSPNGSSDHNRLGSVTVINANDIWAVGNTGFGLSNLSTLTEHWNGSSWNVVPSPNGSFAVNFLADVDGVASNDVWAVGYSWNGSTSNNQARTLILHWNGSNWSVVPSPNTTRPENRLLGVVAISANNVWAVGSSYDYTFYKTLIMHWDGTKWSLVPSPNPGSFNILYGVDAVSANDVWAVGTQQDNLEQTLVLHWNGTSWSVVPSPQVGPYGNNMLEVHAVSANDIWAVGYHLTVFGFAQPYQTSTFHYDGTRWSVVPSPNVNQNNNYLFDVVGLAPDDAWAVGFYDTGTVLKTMIQHWDGASWTIVNSPNGGTASNELVGIDAVSATDIWAVGDFTAGEIEVNTLVEHYSTACSDGTMHVSNLQPSFQPITGGFRVQAVITVVDASGTAVPGATVTVSVILPDRRVVSRTRTTGTRGRATAAVNSSLSGTYTFTVTNVTKAGLTYDPASNVETSDSITVR
jgi:hypothetical protein